MCVLPHQHAVSDAHIVAVSSYHGTLTILFSTFIFVCVCMQMYVCAVDGHVYIFMEKTISDIILQVLFIFFETGALTGAWGL